MNIIVANKLKEDLLKSNFTIKDYKCASGTYTINAIINTISNIDVDYLIIDSTAVEDLNDTASLEKLIKVISPEKIYLYLTQEHMDSYIFVCTLINIGIYNFESSINGLNQLIEKPKTLDDVSAYRSILSSRNSERKNQEMATRPTTEEEMQEKINDYLKSNGIKKKAKKKYNNFLFQLFNGFFMYPAFTLMLTLLYYYFTNYIDILVKPIDGFKEGLNTIIIGNLITPSFLLAIMLGLLLMFFIGKVYEKIIKDRKTVYRKIMLLPVLINFTIFSLDFYVFHFISKISDNHNLLSNNYLANGLESVAFGAAILLLGDYIIHNLFVKKDTIEFEKILENGYSWWEVIDVVFIIIFIILAGSYIILSTSFQNLPITSTINNLYHSSLICIIVCILSIKSILFNLLDYMSKKNKEKN